MDPKARLDRMLVLLARLQAQHPSDVNPVDASEGLECIEDLRFARRVGHALPDGCPTNGELDEHAAFFARAGEALAAEAREFRPQETADA